MVRVSDAKSDCSRRGEAEVRILNFKTTWSEFQIPSENTLAEAKPMYVYLVLKPHGSEFYHLPRVGPKQLCASAHLGRTHEAGTS